MKWNDFRNFDWTIEIRGNEMDTLFDTGIPLYRLLIKCRQIHLEPTPMFGIIRWQGSFRSHPKMENRIISVGIICTHWCFILVAGVIITRIAYARNAYKTKAWGYDKCHCVSEMGEGSFQWHRSWFVLVAHGFQIPAIRINFRAAGQVRSRSFLKPIKLFEFCLSTGKKSWSRAISWRTMIGAKRYLR